MQNVSVKHNNDNAVISSKNPIEINKKSGLSEPLPKEIIAKKIKSKKKLEKSFDNKLAENILTNVISQANPNDLFNADKKEIYHQENHNANNLDNFQNSKQELNK